MEAAECLAVCRACFGIDVCTLCRGVVFLDYKHAVLGEVGGDYLFRHGDFHSGSLGNALFRPRNCHDCIRCGKNVGFVDYVLGDGAVEACVLVVRRNNHARSVKLFALFVGKFGRSRCHFDCRKSGIDGFCNHVFARDNADVVEVVRTNAAVCNYDCVATLGKRQTPDTVLDVVCPTEFAVHCRLRRGQSRAVDGDCVQLSRNKVERTIVHTAGNADVQIGVVCALGIYRISNRSACLEVAKCVTAACTAFGVACAAVDFGVRFLKRPTAVGGDFLCVGINHGNGYFHRLGDAVFRVTDNDCRYVLGQFARGCVGVVGDDFLGFLFLAFLVPSDDFHAGGVKAFAHKVFRLGRQRVYRQAVQRIRNADFDVGCLGDGAFGVADDNLLVGAHKRRVGKVKHVVCYRLGCAVAVSCRDHHARRVECVAH